MEIIIYFYPLPLILIIFLSSLSSPTYLYPSLTSLSSPSHTYLPRQFSSFSFILSLLISHPFLLQSYPSHISSFSSPSYPSLPSHLSSFSSPPYLYYLLRSQFSVFLLFFSIFPYATFSFVFHYTLLSWLLFLVHFPPPLPSPYR